MLDRRSFLGKISTLFGALTIGSFGAKELLAVPTLVADPRHINNKRILHQLRLDLSDLCTSFVGESIDPVLFKQVDSSVRILLQSYKDKRLIEDFRGYCDETINTPTTIDKNELHVAALVKFRMEAQFYEVKVSISSE